MQPYLVDRVVSPNGEEIKSAKPSVWRQPISSDSAETVRDMMVGVVEQGYASSAAIPGLVVGGKTGTAETGSEDPHAWFIGFAGDPEPRYAIAVVLEHGGSSTQEPISIARSMLAAAMEKPQD
jgi:peptidoglycan glycosyltransferase